MGVCSRVRLFETPWAVAARLLCPWDSPGKNTGVGCHFLLQGIFLIRIRASGSYQEGTGKSGSYGMWNHPRGHVWNVFVRPASS